jgi:hypothetical protein
MQRSSKSHTKKMPRKKEGGRLWAQKEQNRPVRSRIWQKSAGLGGFLYLARRNPVRARELDYIQCNNAEHTDKMCYVFDEEGSKSPFIQLPCMVPHINPDTGKIMQMYELPFLYVVEGDHGRHLYIGQSYRTGMTFTRYDGKLVPSDEVKDPTWARSLRYRGHVVDGLGYDDNSQMENNSLGHVANHAYDGSIAKNQHRLCRAPVSKTPESIFLTARRDCFSHCEEGRRADYRGHRKLHVWKHSTGPQDPEESCFGRTNSYRC